MPCALTEPGGYPDYLKKVLKEIAAGNDTDLKACACQLKSPVTDEGCLIVDEDGKIGAFPNCIPLNNTCGSGTPLKLKDAMSVFWRVKKWKFTISGNVITKHLYQNPPGIDTFNYFGSTNISTNIGFIKPPINEQKKLVCETYGFYGESDSTVKCVRTWVGQGGNNVNYHDIKIQIGAPLPSRIDSEDNFYSIDVNYNIENPCFCFSSTCPSAGLKRGTQTTKIDNKIVSVVNLYGLENDENHFNSGDINTTIEAIEYW